MSAARPPSFLRGAVSVGGATLLSRITGLGRDVLLAAALGAGPMADIFVIAFRLPNLFRRLFAEGAFSAAFIPLYAQTITQSGEDAARLFAGRVFSVLLLALVVFTALANVFMPELVMAIAYGFVDDAALFDQTVHYTRIAFPYLIFMSLLAFFAALLNARDRFFAAALAPVLLNFVLMTALALALYLQAAALDYAIWGVAAAGVVQLAFVVMAARRAGIGFAWQWPRVTPEIKHVWVLAIPGILAAGIGQINLLIGTSIASAQSGAPAWLYFADRLYQLPMGVIGVALGVALLPSLSRQLAEGADEAAYRTQNTAIIAGMGLTLPAAVGLAVLAEPLVRLFFERGAFTPAATLATAQAVQLFCIGLPAFVLVKLLQPAFFSRQDTRSPLIDGAIGVGVNILMSVALFAKFGHLAIALATSAAGWTTVILMLMRLHRREIWRPSRDLIWALAIQMVSAALMTVAVIAFVRLLAPYQLVLVAQLGLAIALGAGAYGLGVFSLDPSQRAALRGLRRRS